MPERVVRGVHINYEMIGETGPVIALTPGSRRAYGELVDLAQRIAAHGYRVLLHDRRNCGASEVAFDGSASENEIWADDLYALGQALDALPMYVGGSSSGARLAILYALRHPAALRGLLLWRVTGGKEAVDKLAESYYGQFARIARAGGMQAVCDSEHFADSIRARPANRDRLMQTNVDDFIAVMTTWREMFLKSSELPIAGATEQDLMSLRAPVCIIAGNDVIHSPITARKAAALIPGAVLHEGVVEKLPDDRLRPEWDRAEWRNAEPRIAEIFAAFLTQAEGKQRVAWSSSARSSQPSP
jgi:pimeloyl-ACP methyl ester carboxylesterase